MSSFPAPGRAEGNCREGQIVSKDFPMFDPSRQDFPDFPWKRGSQQRAHDLWRWILTPALPEPLPQEDKWR